MSKRKADDRLEMLKKKQKRFLTVAAIIVVVIISGLILYNFVLKDEEEHDISYRSSIATGQEVRIPVFDINDGDFHYYSQEVDGVDVKFFMVTDKRGDVHSAFDACDVCYDARKGYVQDGDKAKCINCGQRFSIEELGTKNSAGGGCWPGYLEHEVVKGNVLIQLSDLRSGMYYFR
jgi:uncharacterized membrane protein